MDATVIAGAGHAMPTISYGNACAISGEPYINRCRVDAVGKILGAIYDGLKPPARGALQGRYIECDQRPFAPAAAYSSFFWGSGLDSSGWIYVPKACAAGAKCRLHIARHGCKQGQRFLPLHPTLPCPAPCPEMQEGKACA